DALERLVVINDEDGCRTHGLSPEGFGPGVVRPTPQANRVPAPLASRWRRREAVVSVCQYSHWDGGGSQAVGWGGCEGGRGTAFLTAARPRSRLKEVVKTRRTTPESGASPTVVTSFPYVTAGPPESSGRGSRHALMVYQREQAR